MLFIKQCFLLDTKGEGHPSPMMVGTFWTFWYETIFLVHCNVETHLISLETELFVYIV